MKKLSIIIKRDLEGYYVASVSALKDCYAQAKSLGKLQNNTKEIIRLYLGKVVGNSFLERYSL